MVGSFITKNALNFVTVNLLEREDRNGDSTFCDNGGAFNLRADKHHNHHLGVIIGTASRGMSAHERIIRKTERKVVLNPVWRGFLVFVHCEVAFEAVDFGCDFIRRVVDTQS